MLASGLLVAAFIGWPLVTALMPRRSVASADVTPSVLLIVATRGESVAARLADVRAQDYPDVVVVVASDGPPPGDAVGARVSSGPPVGKTAAVARAVAEHADDVDVIAFTDATARWAPGALRALVRPFADPTVGAVSGQVAYDYPRTSLASGFRWYQRLVVASRMAESSRGSLTSVSGSISAIRTSLWSPGRPEVSDDLAIPLRVAQAGRRTVFEPSALSREAARARPRSEYRSRVRAALGAYAYLASLREWRLPLAFRLQVAGGKALRWLAPVLWLVALGTAAALGWLWALTALALPLGLGLVGVPPFSFALTVAAAFLVAIPRYLRGERAVAWEPEDQR